jgi:hypothetical protein
VIPQQAGLALIGKIFDGPAALDHDKAAGLIVAGGRRQRRIPENFLDERQGNLLITKVPDGPPLL